MSFHYLCSWSIWSSQVWTLQRPFSRNSIPEDHINKPSYLNNLWNVFFRRLEDKSSAVTFGNNTNNAKFGNKRGICPRYRFKQSHLRFLGTFADVRDQPGWILPTATKILVNVIHTEDTDAWRGQVEGSEECGMFLCTCWPFVHSPLITSIVFRQCCGTNVAICIGTYVVGHMIPSHLLILTDRFQRVIYWPYALWYPTPSDFDSKQLAYGWSIITVSGKESLDIYCWFLY